MEHLFEGIAALRHWYIKPNENSNKYKSSLLSLNGALPSRKCSIRVHAKCKTSFNEVNWAISLA